MCDACGGMSIGGGSQADVEGRARGGFYFHDRYTCPATKYINKARERTMGKTMA